MLTPEGAIIPLDAAEKPENGCPNPKTLDVRIVVGHDGHFTVYEDDGSGSGIDEANLITTPMHWQQDNAMLTIGPVSSSDSSIPIKRDWTITFLGLPHDLTRSIQFSLGDGAWTNALVEYSARGINVIVPEIRTICRIEISLGVKNPQLHVNNPLKYAFDKKNEVWKILHNTRSLNTKMGDLMALEVPQSLKEVVSEILLADE